MTHSSLNYCVQLTWPKTFPHKYLQKKCKLLHRGSSAFCGWKEKEWKSHSPYGVESCWVRAPPACSVCECAEIFLTSKFNYLLFLPPHPWDESGTATRWEINNSNLPGPIIMIDQSKTGRGSQITFITLFSGSCRAFLSFTSLSKLCKNAGSKPFCKAKMTFLHPIVNWRVAYHILSTKYLSVILWQIFNNLLDLVSNLGALGVALKLLLT